MSVARYLTGSARVAALGVASLAASATIAFATPISTCTVERHREWRRRQSVPLHLHAERNDSTCTPAPCVVEDLVDFAVPIFGAGDFDPAPAIFTREDAFAFAPGPYFYDPTRDPALAANPVAYGPNPGAFASLTSGIFWSFHRTPLLAGETMTLEFNSAYGPTDAPYWATWGLGPVEHRTFFETNVRHGC